MRVNEDGVRPNFLKHCIVLMASLQNMPFASKHPYREPIRRSGSEPSSHHFHQRTSCLNKRRVPSNKVKEQMQEKHLVLGTLF